MAISPFPFIALQSFLACSTLPLTALVNQTTAEAYSSEVGSLITPDSGNRNVAGAETARPFSHFGLAPSKAHHPHRHLQAPLHPTTSLWQNENEHELKNELALAQLAFRRTMLVNLEPCTLLGTQQLHQQEQPGNETGPMVLLRMQTHVTQILLEDSSRKFVAQASNFKGDFQNSPKCIHSRFKGLVLILS
jgi:hypothetical protein